MSRRPTSASRSARLAYLAQEEIFDPAWTVEDAMVAALKEDRAEEHEKDTQIRITLTKTGFTDREQ